MTPHIPHMGKDPYPTPTLVAPQPNAVVQYIIFDDNSPSNDQYQYEGYKSEDITIDDVHPSRSTGATAMNEASSRSHAILVISMQQQLPPCPRTGEVDLLASKLHLVDLAGSERTKRSRVAGVRLRETVNINQVGAVHFGLVVHRRIRMHGICLSCLEDW